MKIKKEVFVSTYVLNTNLILILFQIVEQTDVTQTIKDIFESGNILYCEVQVRFLQIFDD